MIYLFSGLFLKLGKGIELIRLYEVFGFFLEFSYVYISCFFLFFGVESDDRREGGEVIY